MKLFVAVTDRKWFEQLALSKPDEVNFWRPSGATSFRPLMPGEPLLFKLHAPLNIITGFGYFVSYSVLPVSLAWAAFGPKNGVADQHALRSRVRQYRTEDPGHDPNIGCIILTQPQFFPRDQWIPCPSSFSRSIVQGKTYDTSEPDGRELWALIEARMARSGRYGEPVEVRSRLGQGAFRVLVTEAYQRRCAVTGEKTLPVLEAAHIKPFKDGPNETRNGLLLRADLHNLYDRGLMTVTPDYRVEVSPRIREDNGNGKVYYALHGQPLSVVPDRTTDQPQQEYLEWHNQNVYER